MMMKKGVKITAVYSIVISLILLTFSSCNHGAKSVPGNGNEPSIAETSDTDTAGESTDSMGDTTFTDSTTGTFTSAGNAPESALATPAAARSTKTTAAAQAPTAANSSDNRIQYPVMKSDLQPLTESVDKSKLYFRSLLSSDEQQLYDFFLYYAERCDNRLIYVPNLTIDHYLEITGCIYKDNPQLFWEKQYPDVPSGYSADDHVFQLDYQYPRDEAARMQKKIDSKTQAILSGISSSQSQYDTELYLHDYLVNNCTFAWGNQWGDNSCNIYGALLNDKPASEAYARGMQFLLEKEGIPCIYVFGTAVGGHAWNIVYIDNAYYQLDVTRDDPDSAYCSSLSHRFFNVTTQMMLNDGRKFITESDYREFPLPQCTATADNYDVKNGINR